MSDIVITDADPSPRSAAVIVRPGQEDTIAQRRRLTSYWTRRVMFNVVANEPVLMQVVADGAFAWRQAFLREMLPAGLYVDEGIADSIYAFFCKMVRKRIRAKGSAQRMSSAQLATLFLDKVAPPAPPPSAREIIDSLEIDSESSDDGRRYLYGRDGAPQIELEKMKDQMKSELRTDGTLPALDQPKP